MALREILEYPHPRLRERASPATVFDAELGRLIDDMLETLGATNSLALSAPQVDDHRAVLVINPSSAGPALCTYVNPRILSQSAWGLVQESCLSLPGLVGNVWRATEIRVRACDRDGETFETHLAGLDAVCLQHELDHLEGKLFLDRLSVLKRLRFHVFAGIRPRPRHRPA